MKKKYVEPTVLLLDYVVEDIMRVSLTDKGFVDCPDDWWD